MNSFMKMLAISCASIMMVTEYGTAQNADCVRPVQGFVSLGLYGARSKIQGEINLKQLFSGITTSDQFNELTGGAVTFTKIDQDKLKDKIRGAVSISMNPDHNEDQSSDGIEFYAREKANTDNAPNSPQPNVQNSAGANIPWEQSDQKAKITLSKLVKNDDGTYTATAKFNMEGAPTHIVPKGSALNKYFWNNNAFDSSASQNGGIGNENADATYYDVDNPAPELTLKLTPKLNISDLPVDNIYKITTSDTNKSNSTSFTGTNWQMAGFVNLGMLVNFSRGGAWYLALFADKPFVNSTQKITLGDTSSNNNNSIDAKNKWSLGLETGLRCNITEKVYLGIGGGVQWSWYEFSAKTNNNPTSNNTSETLKQDMKGTAPFMKLSLGFNINKNFGVEIFGKYTGKHDLKHKDSKKKNDNSSSKEWPINFTKQGSPSFGIAATFTF